MLSSWTSGRPLTLSKEIIIDKLLMYEVDEQ